MNTQSEAPFLEALAAVFARRRKAIRYHLRTLMIDELFNEDASSLESVLLEADLLLPRGRLNLEVWPDRWLQFDARQASKKGWIWQFAVEGRLIGGLAPPQIVAAVEASIAAAGNSTELGEVWEPILARGPRLVA